MKLTELQMLVDDRTTGDQLITEVEMLRRRKKAYWPLLREVASYWTLEYLEVTDRYQRIVDVYQATESDKTHSDTARIELGEYDSFNGGILKIMARVSVTRKMLKSDIAFTAENIAAWDNINLGNERLEPPFGIGIKLPENPQGWADTYFGHENPELCIAGAVSSLASVIRPARETQTMLIEALSSVELNTAITPELLKQHGLNPTYK